MTELLRIKQLSKTYNNKDYALSSINLTVQTGEFIVIIGPSGAGKSTLIRSINRLIEPTAGELIFDGQAIEAARGKQLRHVRANIGMIFQHYNLVDRTNVLKNVLHGRLGHVSFFTSLFGRYSEEDKQEALRLLGKVGLASQIYKRASELSGGQMQRVGICRAIMQRPKLILADEPIASLDPKSATIVMDQLKQITTERSITCMVNLHQVDFAKKYATRIIGIKDGTIVFDGQPQQLTDAVIAAIYAGKEEQQYLPEQQPVEGGLQYGEIY